jgi:hypothetical protein
MTVYYDRGDIEVTSDHLWVGAALYPMRSIRGVRVRRRATGIALALVGVGLVALAAGTVEFMHIALVAGALVIAAGAGTAALYIRRRHQLWIDYGGRLTHVVSSGEEWRMRQLARAIHKALEET